MHRLTDSKILVVEDDPKMCESIRTLLNIHGFDVQTSTTLSEAQNAIQDDRYDLVLLDLKLEDQCGFALMDQLVDRQMDTRVIIVTGQHSEKYAIMALKKGATDYLKKPFEADELIDSVNTVLKRQRHRRELELFKHAVSTSSAAIVVGGPDGKIVYTNNAYRKLIHANDGAGWRPMRVSNNDKGYVVIDEQIRKALETGMSWKGKTELLDAYGKSFVVCKLVDPIPEQIGGTSYGLALMTDMTAQLETSRTVANSRERYRKVIDSQKEFLFRLDSEFRITFVNQTYADSQGKPPRTMIGVPITAFVQESNQPILLYAIDAVRSGSKPIEIEIMVRDENRIPRWQKWQFEGIYSSDGHLSELQGVGRDVSVRKRAEKRLQEESDKLKQALAKVKRLSGMLPICASCKKIRDGSGYWSRIEEYIENNSDVTFSHSICPECAHKLYPELYE